MLKFKSLVAAVGLTALAATSWAADITGAGATFPFPIYAKWAEGYKAATGTGMNYQAVSVKFAPKQSHLAPQMHLCLALTSTKTAWFSSPPSSVAPCP
jgi:hypothetical protein